VPGDEEERTTDHVWRPDQAIHRRRAEFLDERVDQVDREDERASEENQSTESLQPRLASDLQHRSEAAGAEEDAADQVDRRAGGLVDAGLGEAGPERKERAADQERCRGEGVDR